MLAYDGSSWTEAASRFAATSLVARMVEERIVHVPVVLCMPTGVVF